MGSYKNLHVFNQIILLESQKFDAREIYVFYSIADECLHGVCEKSYFRHLWHRNLHVNYMAPENHMWAYH